MTEEERQHKTGEKEFRVRKEKIIARSEMKEVKPN